MARITVPSGYTSWNTYIQAMVDAAPVDIDARRELKRGIKLRMIAAVERSAAGEIDIEGSRRPKLEIAISKMLIGRSGTPVNIERVVSAIAVARIKVAADPNHRGYADTYKRSSVGSFLNIDVA